MADLQISQLPVLTSVAAADEVPIVDVSGSETRKITAKNLIQQGVALIDAGSIPGSALASLGANTVVTASITDANVTNAKLEHSSFSLGGLSISLGSTDSTPSFDLTDATNYPASSLTGTITNAQLAGSIANNKLANSSISLAGVSINLGDTIATPTFDLTNATNYPASSLTGTVSNAQLAGSIANSKLVNSSINIGGVTFNLGDSDTSPALDLSDATNYPTSSLSGTITNAQLAGSIQGSKILAGSISATELGTNSVTAVELANLSVDTAALIDASVTDVKISAVSGTKITAGSLPATAINASNLGTGLAISSNNLVINNTVSAGSAAKVTFSSVGLITGSASLAASDLPLATTTSVGGISVGGGLSVTGAGALSLSNSISAATVSGIQFNAFGQIVSATSLTSSDLPLSTTSQVGGVQITSGGGLSVDGSGGLSTSTSGISAGTYTKLTINTKGVATAGQLLVAGDIPDIPATKLTTGVIDAGRIGAGTIDSSKLSDSSTAIIQSIAQLGFPTAGVFTGQLLFDPIAEDAYLWDGNAWNPITTLTKGALQRFGTFDANLSQVDSVTSAGAAAGLSIGANLPVASESVDGGYVVISVQGTPSGVAGITGQLSPPDYLLGVTNTGGSSWQEIDLSSTVASQVASQIGYTPFGQISSNNVQSAIDELETEKLAKSGGEVTGELLIGSTGSLVFEGSTADAFETKLVAQDPSVSDKILTLPNITGTLVTTGDTDTVTSTMVDGSLTNTNLAANAAIAFTKLASLTAASILVGNASNEVAGVPVTGDISIDNAGLTAIGAGKIVNSMVSGTAAIDGSKVTAASTSASGTVQLNDSTNSTSTSEAATANALKTAYDLANTANTAAAAAFQTTGGSITGDVTLANAKELRFSEASGDGSNYTAFKAQAQSSDITYSWPNTSPSAGQVLKASATTPTTLEWAADSATDNTKMPLAGGTFTNDVTFTGDSSNGLWDKSASAFVANLTGNVTGNVSGTSGGFTAGSASNLDAGTVNVARLGSGASSSKFLRGDNTWQTVTGTTINNNADNRLITGSGTANTLEGEANLTFDGAKLTIDGSSGTGEIIGLTGSLEPRINYYENTTLKAHLIWQSSNGEFYIQNVEHQNILSVGSTLRWSTNNGGNFTTILDQSNLAANVGSGGLLASTNVYVNQIHGSGANLTSLNATNLGSGIVPTARLGSGSASSSTFLAGDNTWQTITSVGGNTGVDFNDNIKARFGTANEIELEWNTTGSYFYLGGKAGVEKDFVSRFEDYEFLTGPSSGAKKAIKIVDEAQVEIYHNDVKRLETQTDGIKITAGEGEEANITFFADEGDNASDKFRLRTEDSGGFSIESYDGSSWETNLKTSLNSSIELYFNDVKRFQTLSVGANVVGSLGINTTSPTTYNANADELVLHNPSGTCGMTISSPNDTIGRIAFADPEDNNIGEVRYSHATNAMDFTVNASTSLTLDSSQNATFAGSVTATSFSGSGASLTSLNASNISSGTLPAARINGLAFDGSNITNLPATGGTFTATASGSLTAGQVVFLNSSGQLKKPSNTITANNPVDVGTFVGMYLTRTTYSPRAVWDDVNKIGVNWCPSSAYNNGSSAQFYLTPFTLDESSTPALMVMGSQTSAGSARASSSTFQCICVGQPTSTTSRFLAVWKQTNNYSVAQCFDTNGSNTLSFVGSQVQVGHLGYGYRVYSDPQGICKTGTAGQYLWSGYNASASRGGVELLTVDASGNVTRGNSLETSANHGQQYDKYSNCFYDPTADRVIVWWQDKNSPYYHNWTNFRVNGASLTKNSTGNTGAYYTSTVCTFDETLSKFCMAAGDQTNNRQVVVLGTVNSSGLSYTITQIFNSNNWSSEVSGTIDANSGRVIVSFAQSGNTSPLTIQSAPISGNSPGTWTTGANLPSYLMQKYNYHGPMINIPHLSELMFFVHQYNSSYSYRRAMEYGLKVAVVTTDLTADNFLGIAQSSGSGTRTVDVISAINTQVSGLTVGSKYYAQGDGTIATSPDALAGSIPVGMALASNKLLIKH